MSKSIMKLNTLLAKTDHLSSVFKQGLTEYCKFFKDKQTVFKGEKKTYQPRKDMIDFPEERANKLVVTTVNEKLKYLVENSTEYINALFSQERTNASGKSKAVLIVDGQNFGEFTSLELLKLKTLLENTAFKEMYENLPVRTENELWTKCTADDNSDYSERGIFQSEMSKGVRKTTVKEQYILPDPNVKDKDTRYTPQVASKDTIIELGDYTHQRFSGETTHSERAHILQRRSKLLSAVLEALKVANDVEAMESEMTAAKLFGYLHEGKI